MVWNVDSELGAPFEAVTLSGGHDYAGEVRCTLVRVLSVERGRAFLYVHGFNDYFLQDEMARMFADCGWDFYAVDLRRYGRSLRAGERPFEVRDLSEYFGDIEASLQVIRSEGARTIVLMGHSTGGLTSAYFMGRRHPSQVNGLVLNSPFLDWNMPPVVKRTVIPLIGAIGRIAPRLTIKQNSGEAYGESLLAGRHGQWHFRTDWKPLALPPVTAGWIGAIDRAQRWLRRHEPCIDVPVLLLRSDASTSGRDWHEGYDHADGILNVADISKIGRRLGRNLVEDVIPGGRHDLALSADSARYAFYYAIRAWLRRF